MIYKEGHQVAFVADPETLVAIRDGVFSFLTTLVLFLP